MRILGLTTLAVVLMLAGTAKSQAQDTILLGGTGEATTQTLVFDGQADLEQVYYRGGVGYRGGVAYRGGVGYRGYGYGGYRYGYGGYRPIYRPYVRAAYYRPYWYGGYYPYAYYPSYYYNPYYSSPSYYYPTDYSYYYNPIAADASNLPSATVLGSSSYSQGPIFRTSPGIRLAPPGGDGTYNYDGGPGQPLPLPPVDGPAPIFEQKRPTVPYEGKLVSIPAQQPTKYSYSAYGDKTPAPIQQPTVATTPLRPIAATSAAKVAAPSAYPAYGDR